MMMWSVEGKVLLGLVLSQLMGGIRGIALPLLVYGSTGSLTNASVVALCGLLPGLTVGLVGAPVIDRMDRRRSIIVATLYGSVFNQGARAIGRLSLHDEVEAQAQ
jgi:MFS family permease